MSAGHANSKFSKAGYCNCWIHAANMPSEAVIQRLSTFSPVVLLNSQKGASPQSPIDFALLHWCCATFLLKTYSRLCLCFCRRKEYSFFLDPFSPKLNALGSSGIACAVDNILNTRSHLQNSHSFNIIFLNPQILTHYFHFPFQPNNSRTTSSFSSSLPLTLLSMAVKEEFNDIKGFNEEASFFEGLDRKSRVT